MASSIYIPIPPASVHLILNGLLGVVLGYFAFPAILIGLLFQALVIGHGGLTTLGVNAAMMGHSRPAGLPHLPTAAVGGEGPAGVGWQRRCLPFLGGSLGLGMSALIFLTLVITNIPADFDARAERSAILTLSVGTRSPDAAGGCLYRPAGAIFAAGKARVT